MSKTSAVRLAAMWRAAGRKVRIVPAVIGKRTFYVVEVF